MLQAVWRNTVALAEAQERHSRHDVAPWLELCFTGADNLRDSGHLS